MDVLKFLQDLITVFGWPGAILVLAGAGLWRIWVWLQPRLDRVVDTHVEYVQKTGAAFEKLSGTVSGEMFPKINGAHGALGPLADAIAASAPPDRRPEVQPHVDRAKNALAGREV